HTRFSRDWSSDVCSSDLPGRFPAGAWKGCRHRDRGSPRRPAPGALPGGWWGLIGSSRAPGGRGAAALLPEDGKEQGLLRVEAVRSEERRVGKDWGALIET